MRAVILAGGPDVDYEQLRSIIRTDDLLVLADGGIGHALRLGLEPTQVIGDFDSVRSDDLREAERRGWPLRRVPREKDETDTELAVAWTVAQGATDIVIAGGTGGRLDHALANLMLLPRLAESGVSAALIDGRNEARALIGGNTLRIAGSARDYLSLIPISPEAHGVTVTGLKYPLTGATLLRGKTLAVSNEFAADAATVTCEDGILLVVKSRD